MDEGYNKKEGYTKRVLTDNIKTVINDLTEKRDLMLNHSFNLSDLNPKDMPEAIYNYAIAQLQEVVKSVEEEES